MKKKVQKVVAFIVIMFSAILVFSIVSYSPEYMYRILRYRESDVNDYNIFPERTIASSANPYYYEEKAMALEDKLISYTYNGEIHEKELKKFLEDTQTTSFIIIHNDKIVFEQYYNEHSRDSINTSFSSVKSIVSLLIGIAIDEGYIENEKQSIAEYIHEFKGTPFADITIEDLLMMRSKIRYKEGYLWFGDDAKTYYMPNLRELAINDIKIDTDYEEGKFHYNNFHPLLLGIILERSTNQSVSSFLEGKLWQKLGTEYNASWSLDSNDSGFEKMESGLNFRTIDFAKIGSMLLHMGKWNGEEIISEDWIIKSTFAKFPLNQQEYKNSLLEDIGVGYKYMWYSFENKRGGYDYFAAGKYEQYLYISPDNNIVIVRNGIEAGNVDWWAAVLEDITNIVVEFQD
ncbi:serine hydrolase domain-containing protein [Alkaliphilus peptidifermentans]|uniref:CubicO group peptidase, beta-lactamase class C family n=1 Tax=Alkaliphilus peptidifermentans DSM 18978 TaxID=1120976 RepID=A0A1G5GZ73_9FIRM|nr:serine hydrolase [Alkaliphilus peptidifermentans]SCY56784.1 CubicO group peptidase, beta-lactamase class C family [Alkaliphilus peptidifermentans DSM 18978]